MSEPLYSVGTWDAERQAYVPDNSTNLTLAQLRRELTLLRGCGYSAHSRGKKDKAGHRYDCDWLVLVERTDGMSEAKILERWQR